MTLQMVLFNLFSSLALVSALMVISAMNPIHSVLFLILVFCNAGALLILLGAEFLAMLFLIVYVGAIAVLFLFVVMMLNIKLVEGPAGYKENLVRYLPVGLVVGLVFFAEVLLVVDADLMHLVPAAASLGDLFSQEIILWASSVEAVTNIEVLGRLLYTHYFSLFIISGLILLVSMIGAIVLTLHRRGDVRRQEIHEQLARDFHTTVQNRDIVRG